MKYNANILVNVDPTKSKPEAVANYLAQLDEEIKKHPGLEDVQVQTGKRGRPRQAGQHAARVNNVAVEERKMGPVEKAWCKKHDSSRVRCSEGRDFEQQAIHNFRRYDGLSDAEIQKIQGTSAVVAPVTAQSADTVAAANSKGKKAA